MTYNQDFLKRLADSRNQQTHVRIISLDINHFPQESIEGLITTGSINIDGKSAVRRLCSLSLTVGQDHPIITDKYWCYNTNFKLQIGINNAIDQINYPPIIWFDMGTFIITSFSYNKSTTSLTVSLQGKDKMCRLNGEVSGNIAMSTDFGVIEDVKITEANEYHTTITKLPIYTIIQNAVKTYGLENHNNIVINDLDQCGYELWNYRGESPMYLFLLRPTRAEIESGQKYPKVLNMTFNGDLEIDIVDDGYYMVGCNDGKSEKRIRLKDLGDAINFKFYSMNTLDIGYNDNANLIYWDTTITSATSNEDKEKAQKCYIAKCEYGDTVGYHPIPLVYNNDLILNAGDTVTSLLDKLKNMLGDFEYFYDVEGRFIFQKKNNYISELFSPIDGELVTPIKYATPYSYRIDDGTTIISEAVQPNINNIKNDFSIWGVRSSANGTDISIHARYALDKKPTYYKTCGTWDKEKQQWKSDSRIYYTTAYTKTVGSNAICVDWREIIYQMALDFYAYNQNNTFLLRVAENNPNCTDGKTKYEQYYADMQGFWRQLYNPKNTQKDKDLATASGYDYYGKETSHSYSYWNKAIHTNPAILNFWFDFLDTKGELGNYSAYKIGPRPKVVSENSIKSIYFKDTPEVLFIVAPQETLDTNAQKAYTPIWIQDSMEQLFYKSTQGLSAINKANELIYTHTACIDTLTLSLIPNFGLQVNTRIYIEGHGDYTIDKISYSLGHAGNMSLTCSKIAQYIY